jgi:hypothetical protein
MRLKKVIAVLFIPTAIQIAIACCDCIVPALKNYSNKSMTVDNLDNSGEKPTVTSSSSVSKKAYGIQVNFHREIVAYDQNPLPIFFQTAYALTCDCPPPLEILARDSIVTLRIFSVYDFDSNHPVNSDISEYFKIFENNSFITINEYVKFRKEYTYRYGNSKSGWTLYDESELESQITLLLMTAPKININNKFKVQIILSDGRMFEQETTEIDFI